MNTQSYIKVGLMATISLLVLSLLPAVAKADSSILSGLNNISVVASTVPSNGDVNPYGVAMVTTTVGNLTEGHILVSNFNNSSNLQGTGVTIVDVSPGGSVAIFAQLDAATLPGSCPGGIGLTTALVFLRSGWVIVGSLPTSNGMPATAEAGCLIVLDSMGKPVETIFGSLINGPWDMTAFEGDHEAKLFVTNVLNGTVAGNGQIVDQGTVVRIDLTISDESIPFVESMTVIGSGFSERTDPSALVIGPTGVGISRRGIGDDARDAGDGVLYVADSLNNRVMAIPDALDRTTSAGTGSIFSTGGSLSDPLGLVVAPNGHILTVNGNNGFITEINRQGVQVATKQLDSSGTPAGAGTLFGLAFDPSKGVFFVDDGTNTLNLLH